MLPVRGDPVSGLSRHNGRLSPLLDAPFQADSRPALPSASDRHVREADRQRTVSTHCRRSTSPEAVGRAVLNATPCASRKLTSVATGTWPGAAVRHRGRQRAVVACLLDSVMAQAKAQAAAASQEAAVVSGKPAWPMHWRLSAVVVGLALASLAGWAADIPLLTTLKLTRFLGPFTLTKEGVRHAQDQAAASGGVQTANRRVAHGRPRSGRAVA